MCVSSWTNQLVWLQQAVDSLPTRLTRVVLTPDPDLVTDRPGGI